MPSVQIKDVPPDVHRVLRTRAAAAGQSLQEYLLARLVQAAREEPLEEVLARAGGRSGGSPTTGRTATPPGRGWSASGWSRRRLSTSR